MNVVFSRFSQTKLVVVNVLNQPDNEISILIKLEAEILALTETDV
jgi:hypothetical protein